MRTGSDAIAIAVFTRTASAPISSASAAWLGAPRPASTTTGTVACSIMISICGRVSIPRLLPIGSHRGIETRPQIEIIIEQATVPVVVDAGLGAPSQAAEAMEMGADAVLVNTAIAIASDPVRMAQAFKKAIEAGREAHEIGLGEKHRTASATSPLTAYFSGKTTPD